MKRKQSFLTRLFGRKGLISQAELDHRLACGHEYVDMILRHNAGLDRVNREQTAQIKELQARVDELESALAECVAGLREISVFSPFRSAFENARRRRETANETLARIPTEAIREADTS